MARIAPSAAGDPGRPSVPAGPGPGSGGLAPPPRGLGLAGPDALLATRPFRRGPAYQVVGEGEPDLVLVPEFWHSIEAQWEEPALATFLHRLSSFGPGREYFSWVSHAGNFLDEIERFVGGISRAPEVDRVLATVLFTDIVGSTQRASELGDRGWAELLAAHHAAVRRELERFRGREIDTTGDGFLAMFDGPARAVRCAVAIRDAVRPLGLEIRAGLHTGEVELADGDVAGMAVHIGQRVMAEAGPGVVLVSSTVRDLVGGSGLAFSDEGPRALKGVPEEWRLFRVLE